MANQLLASLDPVAPGVPFYVAARCYWPNASVLTLLRQADVSGTSLAWATYLKTTPTARTFEASGGVPVAGSVFDTLQAGSAWTLDPTGYNLLVRVPSVLVGGGLYVVEVTFTLVAGDNVKLGWLVPALAMP